MNEQIIKLIDKKLFQQEKLLRKSIKSNMKMEFKKYDKEIIKKDYGYKISLPIIIYPKYDENKIKPLTFHEASQKYQSAVLVVTIDIPKNK